MASNKEKIQFPPQHQSEQPGQEYVMNPLPVALNPNYKASSKLKGKVALITGGDSGIGRAVSYLFAMEGATVAFTYVAGREDRDKDETLQTIKQIKSSDSKDPIAIATDVKYEENCKCVVDQVVSQFGQIDILVNNAAEQFYTTSVEDVTETRLDSVFRTNIYSQFFFTRHAVKHMKEGSCIINSTSVVAYRGEKELLDYSATKGAIVTFTRSLSALLLSKGIRVNAVAPGPIWTPLQPASLPVENIVKFGSDTPMGRAGQPFELAPAYLFLASNDLSSYVTGQTIHVNGGTIVNG